MSNKPILWLKFFVGFSRHKFQPLESFYVVSRQRLRGSNLAALSYQTLSQDYKPIPYLFPSCISQISDKFLTTILITAPSQAERKYRLGGCNTWNPSGYEGKQLQKTIFDKDTYQVKAEDRPTLRHAIKYYLFLISEDPHLLCRCPRGEVSFYRNPKHTHHRGKT